MDISGAPTRPRIVLFSYGFRPFFLLAGIYVILPVAAVIWVLMGGEWPTSALPPYTWHGHEMLFGFVSAAIAGFLLTAVPTWTGTKAVSGLPLACLALLWLASRAVLSPWVGSPNLFTQVLAIAFFPALAVTVAVPLVKKKNFRNLPFILILATLFLGDFTSLSRHFGWTGDQTLDGQRLALNTISLLIVIIGGRIIPAFTRNKLITMQRASNMRSQKLLDTTSILSVVAVLFGDIVAADTKLTGLLAAITAILLFIRLTGWGGHRVKDIPLLWVLHLGYFWLVLAFALKALWFAGGFGWAMNWVHAFTVGAFGTMILGVMTRVALGHTGRPLEISRGIMVSYLLVSAAALIRVFGPVLDGSYYTKALVTAASAWALAFVIFLLVYSRILIGPRVDE